jgi:hypothetical protein
MRSPVPGSIRMRRSPSRISSGRWTRSRGRLLEQARGAQQEDERRGAPVHHRDLRAVDLDPEVVDAEAVDRGQEVLDGADRRPAAPEGGGVAGGGHGVGARRNLDRRRQVGAHEDDAAPRPRRPQRDLHRLARVQADACTGDLLGDRMLVHVALTPSSARSAVRGPPPRGPG